MKSLEYYRLVLGLDAAATPEQVRQAYIDLVKRWHPDQFSHNPALQKDAEAKLKEINEAYKELQGNFGTSSQTVHTRGAQTGAAQAGAAQAQAHASTSTRNDRPNKKQYEKPAEEKPPVNPYRFRYRAKSDPDKRHRSFRSLSMRVLTAVLGLISVFLAMAALVRHVDFERLSGSSGTSASESMQATQTAPAGAPKGSAESVEQLKSSYDGTLKLLLQDEQERGRLQVEYAQRHELFTRNMISREALAEAEKALAQATSKVAEDKERLAKAELAIAEAAVAAQSKLKEAEKQ